MPLSSPSTARGIALALVSLALLGVMPIISNLRPSDMGPLSFAFALSVWQVVFAELVPPEPGRPPVHTVDRDIHALNAVKCGQHEAVPAESHNHIRLILTRIAKP